MKPYFTSVYFSSVQNTLAHPSRRFRYPVATSMLLLAVEFPGNNQRILRSPSKSQRSIYTWDGNHPDAAAFTLFRISSGVSTGSSRRGIPTWYRFPKFTYSGSVFSKQLQGGHRQFLEFIGMIMINKEIPFSLHIFRFHCTSHNG